MAGAHARAGRLRNRPRRRLARRQFVPDAYGRKARGGRFGIYLPNSFSNDRRSPRPRRRLLLELLSYDGTDSALGNVILAKAGIQTWRPLRPLPLDSRFRGNDNAGDSVKSRHALAQGILRLTVEGSRDLTSIDEMRIAATGPKRQLSLCALRAASFRHPAIRRRRAAAPRSPPAGTRGVSSPRSGIASATISFRIAGVGLR